MALSGIRPISPSISARMELPCLNVKILVSLAADSFMNPGNSIRAHTAATFGIIRPCKPLG